MKFKLVEAVSDFNSMKKSLSTYEGNLPFRYDSEYSSYINQLYAKAVNNLEKKFSNLFIEPSIQLGSGSIIATFNYNGEKCGAEWDYGEESGKIDDLIINSKSEAEFIKDLAKYIETKLLDDCAEDFSSSDIAIIPANEARSGFIPSSTAAKFSKAKHIKVEEGITEIDSNCFNSFKKLESIDLPNTLERIGYYAFAHCKKLTSIRIPDSVTSIGMGVFYDCEKLRDVIIGEGVTELSDKWYFRWCFNLKAIMIPDSVTSMNDKMFDSCPDIIIYCNPNSYAHQYAIKHNLTTRFYEDVVNDSESGIFEAASDKSLNEANLGRKFSELEKANNNLINKIRKEFRKFTDHHYYDVDAGEYNWHVWNKDDFKHMQQFLRDLNIPLHSDNADDYEVYDEWRDDEGWGDFAIWNSYRLIHRLYPNIKYERTSNWAKQYGYNENPQWIVDGDDNKMNEDMSIRAKLKALYPELNFGDEVVDESLNEEVDSEIAIPTPYDKYFEIIEVEYDEDDDYSYKPGDKIDDVTILADVAAKDEWADQFDSIYSLTDDSQFPIVEIVHDRLYPVELPEDDLNEATDNQVAGQMSFFDDDMDFDIEEDDEIRRMNTLYKGADFDAYDDEALEESSDCEDDECWENDLISDDYDDGM